MDDTDTTPAPGAGAAGSAHALARHLLNPASVAVIGASDDPLRIGGRPIAAMLARGYRGSLLPVNPKRTTIQGLPAYASVDDLPTTPEVAIVAVAAAEVIPTLDRLGARGTRAAVVFSAGFAEVGPQGEALEAALLATARRHGLRILGPNTLGLLVPSNGFYGSFTSTVESGYPKAGRIAIASQSGAYGGHILWLARELGIGLSACVLTGNEADITLGDVLEVLVDDPDTDVIAVYSEGIRDGARFIAALEAARRARKPVVMMKVGASALGGEAARSHTASIAGNDRVTDAVLAEFGVCRARSTEHLLDVARLAARRIYPVSNALGVLTISGGAGVIVADAAEAEGLPMPPMPEPAQQALKALIPFSSPRNPVDCTAQVLNDPTVIGAFLEQTVAAGGYPSVLVFFTYTGGVPSIGTVVRREMAAVRQRHPDRLVVACILASPDQVQAYEEAGLPVFGDPGRAVAAIAAMGRFGEAFARTSPVPLGAAAADADAYADAHADAYAAAEPAPVILPATAVNEADALALLGPAGIATVPQRVCADAGAAVAAAESFGYPVVLKIASPDIAHKSDIGGVLLDIGDAAAVRAGHAILLERARRACPDARLDGVLVARQLTGGIECLAGIQRDPVFGPIAVVGLGGIFVELLGDVVLRRCPFSETEARDMIRAIKGAAILDGARGRAPADVAALARLLARLSAFAAAAGPRLRSIDLNPVIVLPDGQGAYAVDGVIDVGDVTVPGSDSPDARQGFSSAGTIPAGLSRRANSARRPG